MIDLILRISLVALQAAQTLALFMLVRRLRAKAATETPAMAGTEPGDDPIEVLGHQIKHRIWQASNWSGASQ